LRVHLLDNTVLRELGLDNTFKSLQCTMQSTVDETIDQMLKKMRRALSGAQADLLNVHCQKYALYLDVEDSLEEFEENGDPMISRLIQKHEFPFWIQQHHPNVKILYRQRDDTLDRKVVRIYFGMYLFVR